jgi:hypothetical protein
MPVGAGDSAKLACRWRPVTRSQRERASADPTDGAGATAAAADLAGRADMDRVVDATAPAVLRVGEGIDAVAALTADLPRGEAEAANTGTALATTRMAGRAVIAAGPAVLGVSPEVDAGASAAGAAPLPSRATPGGGPAQGWLGRPHKSEHGPASNTAKYGPSAASASKRLGDGIEAGPFHGRLLGSGRDSGCRPPAGAARVLLEVAPCEEERRAARPACLPTNEPVSPQRPLFRSDHLAAAGSPTPGAPNSTSAGRPEVLVVGHRGVPSSLNCLR